METATFLVRLRYNYVGRNLGTMVQSFFLGPLLPNLTFTPGDREPD